ncbi:MAG: oligosaccharide repeat unit polymerase [Sulfurospirillum sp.]|nr:oligosaccharide repeat unit polymerase [Sulfurospirillum sp.]
MNLEKYIVVAFALLLPFGYLGRGLFYIDLFLILILFVIFAIKYKINFTPINKLYFLLIVCIFYSFILFINLLNPTTDYSQNIKMLAYLPIFLYILNYIFTISKFSQNNFLLFQKILFYIVSIISFFVFISFVSDIDIIHTIKNFKIEEFNHSIFHSRQNLFAVCIAFFLSYYFKNQTKFNLFFLLIIYLGTFASHGRTAILTITIGTVTYFLYDMYQKKEFTKKKFYIITALCLMTLFLILFISGSNFDKLEINTSNRYNGWLIYLNLILEKNTLIGYGLQGGQYVYEHGFLAYKHPHNIFIESLFYLGLIGLFLLSCMIFLYAYTIWRKNKELYDKNLMVSFFASVLVMQQAIGSLLGANNVILLLLIMYLSLNAKIHREKPNDC